MDVKQSEFEAMREIRAFVEGACWWQFHANNSTAFTSERLQMEAEAIKRYGQPCDICHGVGQVYTPDGEHLGACLFCQPDNSA